jgi:hypothetical protein
MVSHYREIAHQTLKNQTTGNLKIRCRLEKIGKTGNNTQLKATVFHWSMPILVNDAKEQFFKELSYESKIRLYGKDAVC